SGRSILARAKADCPDRCGFCRRMMARPAEAQPWSDADYAKSPAHLGERGNRVIEMLAGMRRAHLRADACLSLRHNRVEETGDVDAFVEQGGGHRLRFLG